MTSRFEVLESHKDATVVKYFWHRKSQNNEIMCSSQRYKTMNGCVRSLRRAVRDFCEDAGISLKTFIRLYMDDFKYYTWNPDATANAWEEHMVFDTPEQALETWAATGIDNEDPTPVNNFAGEGAETIPDLPKRSPTGEPLY